MPTPVAQISTFSVFTPSSSFSLKVNIRKRTGRQRRQHLEAGPEHRGLLRLGSARTVPQRLRLQGARLHERAERQQRGPQIRFRGRVPRRPPTHHHGGPDDVSEQDNRLEDALRDAAVGQPDRARLAEVPDLRKCALEL